MSALSVGQKKHALVGINTHVTYHLYPQRRPIKFGREDLKLLSQVIYLFHNFMKLLTFLNYSKS